MNNLFLRTYNYLFRQYKFYSLDSRSRMFYEIILFRLSLKKHGIDLGDYLEFGVYEGDATIAFYKALKKLKKEQSMKLFLFDSFFGLPEKLNSRDDNGI